MSLVTLAEFKAWLGTTTTGAPAPSATDDTLLQSMLDAATPVIERLTGPMTSTSFTESHDGEDCEVVLYKYPVLTITTCTEYRGSAATANVLTESTAANPIDGFQLEKETGTLIRVFAGGYPRTWWPGSRNIVVVYTAGRASVPENVKEATKELVAHWWKRRKGGSGRFAGAGAEGGAGIFVPTYGVPNAVKEILAGENLGGNLS